jgi:hypothetical protein
MSMSIGEKAERVLRFIMGVRHPEVAEVLAAHGLTDAALDEGWRLLRDLAENRVPTRRGQPARSPEIVAALDQWENRWLPIAEASLARHAPEVGRWLFENLSRQSGPEVILSVHLFTTRVRQLEQGVDTLGDAATRARALLAARGLTEDEMAFAEGQLARFGSIATQPSITPEAPTRDDQQAAEDAMWGWYLEWSAVARAVIRDGNLLRVLGFNANRRRATATGQADDDASARDEAPTPAPGPAPDSPAAG